MLGTQYNCRQSDAKKFDIDSNFSAIVWEIIVRLFMSGSFVLFVFWSPTRQHSQSHHDKSLCFLGSWPCLARKNTSILTIIDLRSFAEGWTLYLCIHIIFTQHHDHHDCQYLISDLGQMFSNLWTRNPYFFRLRSRSQVVDTDGTRK